MTVEFNRNGVLHSYMNVSDIKEADNYLLLECIHGFIECYLNGDWFNNCEAITITKEYLKDMRVLL